jgi:hypothetical protein
MTAGRLSTARLDWHLEEGTDQAGRAGSAVFDSASYYRYELRRGWDDGKPRRTMVVIGCNPSIASSCITDQTVHRCCYFAAREGCNRLIMVNLFALIATQPSALVTARNPVGNPLNDFYLRQALCLPDSILVPAWGNIPRRLEGRADEVTRMMMLLPGTGPVLTFGRTHRGHPKHPCRLGNDARLS